MWDGWFNDETLMEELARIRQASKAVYDNGTQSVAQIAVFVDADSAKYLADPKTRDTVYINNERESGLAVQYDTVYAQQQELHKIGAPVNYFDARDLLNPQFPHEQYRLYIFPNLYAPSDDLKAAVDKLRADGKSCIFLYAPGYIGKEDYSLENMQKLTGFTFHLAEGETDGALTNTENTLSWGGGSGIAPLFTAEAEDGKILASYRQSGLPAGCVKQRDKAIDAWFGCGPVPAEILRPLAKQAGVFIYHEGNDPVYINQGMLGMYSEFGGEKTVCLPADCKLMSLYDTQELASENREVTLQFQPREFKLFLRK